MTTVTDAPPPAREPVPDRYFAAQGTRQPVRLSDDQLAKLTEDLSLDRVSFDYDGHAHVEGWDVRASLTRIFGFGMWSEVITERRLVQERQVGDNWHVSWAVSILLTCWDQYGTPLGPYEGTTVETGAMPNMGLAHELARKAAATVALKRAAINLGNQFGLSLYRKPPMGSDDQRPRTKAVSGTLQPVAIEAGDRSPVDPTVAETEAPEPGDVTVPNAAAPANRATEAGDDTREQHQRADDDLAPVTPSAPVTPARPRTVQDVIKPPPPGDPVPTAVELARAQLRELALSAGVDPEAFDAAVVQACGVPLDEATPDQVRQMRAAIESRYRR